jgi:hypothetical protein
MLLHGLKYFERVRLPSYVSFLVLYKLMCYAVHEQGKVFL